MAVPGRRHFSLAKQRAMIAGHGAAVYVLPALPCPCLDETGHPGPTCLTCYGTGRFYPPGTGFPSTFLLHRESSQLTYQDAGFWLPGIMHATIPPEIILAERDKVRLIDIRFAFTEVLTRGWDDTLLFHAGILLSLVADRERVYRPDVDYVLTPPNVVTWNPGEQVPPFGQHYSVRYQANPEYLVSEDLPRMRIEHRIPQSREVVLELVSKIAAHMP